MAQLRSVELSPVLGQPQGLRNRLRFHPGLSPGGEIYLPRQVSIINQQKQGSLSYYFDFQCDWQPLPGSGHFYHEFQDL